MGGALRTQTDDLAELQLLRVEPNASKARTFVLTMNGRQQGHYSPRPL